MQLFRLRPHVAPRERYEPPVLVNAASLEIAPLLPAARQPHLCPHRFEIAGIGEFVPVAPDHFFRIVAQDRLATRTDAKKLARMVRRQNQIRRRIEQAAALFDFAVERSRLVADICVHAGECPRQNADLAARAGGSDDQFVARQPFDRPRHLRQRSGHGAGDDHRQYECNQHRSERSDCARIANGRRSGNKGGIGKGLNRSDPRTTSQPQLLPCHAEAPAGAVTDDPRSRIIALQQFHQPGVFVLHTRRRTHLKAELALYIGMEEIIARVVHDVDAAAFACSTANAVEYGPQIQIGDDDSKPPTIRCKIVARRPAWSECAEWRLRPASP